MKLTQAMTDKLSISISILCAVHCLILPIILLLIPSIGVLQLDNEAFHTGMLIAVIPISIYALTMGCKKHKQFTFFFIGVLGLTFLAFAGFLGHDFIDEFSEKVLTLIGTGLVVLAHWMNFNLCKKHQQCPCPEANKD